MNFILLLFSAFFVFAEPACKKSTTPEPVEHLLSSMEDIDKFLAAQASRAKGDEERCGSAKGRYILSKNGEVTNVRFSYVHKGYLPFLGANKYKAILRYEKIKKNGDSEFAGLLIETKDGWYLAELKPGIRFPYPSTSQETATIPAFEDFYIRKKDPPGLVIQKVDFSNNMLVGSSSEIKLEYDSSPSIDEFLLEQSNPVSFLNRLSDHTIRVPPKMYDLLNDKEFIRARNARQYSTMYDKIFSKAMELSNNDVEKALFISLITTDLRDRGVCGAIAGKRGYAIVPLSIFDNEVVEASVIGSRLDAAQHFFGYAILAHKFGEDAISAYSSVSKLELQKFFGRFFRYYFHGGREPDFGFDSDPYSLPLISDRYRGVDLRYRPKYDTNADILYNNLGIEFAKRLKANPKIQPSTVIKDRTLDKFTPEIGLPINQAVDWVSEPEEVKLTLLDKDVRNKENEIIYYAKMPARLFAAAKYSKDATIEKIYLFNGYLPVNDCQPRMNWHRNITQKIIIISLQFDKSPACKKFLKNPNKRYIVMGFGQKYYLNDSK